LISLSFQSQQIHPREKPTPPLLSAAPDEGAANRKIKTVSNTAPPAEKVYKEFNAAVRKKSA
jgi:hypothetical protein